MDQKELLKQIKTTDSLYAIQKYIGKVIEIRGFANNPIEEELLLLTEEVGELAKAVRKEKYPVDNKKLKNYDSIESEIADVFIVLTSICNSLKINLYDVIIEKENKNIEIIWQKVEKDKNE